jgi:A nuclease family of the HNH/ENDO VII superfamily with conserved AHH
VGNPGFIVPFAAVNRRGSPAFLDGWHKHHLITTQCMADRELQPIFNAMRSYGANLHDFRINGMLLPAIENQAHAANLPLHIVGHKIYNMWVHEHLHAIRRFCGVFQAAPAARSYAAVILGFLTLAYLRRAVASVGYGSIDETPLLNLSDRDIGTILRAVERLAVHSRQKKCGPQAALS